MRKFTFSFLSLCAIAIVALQSCKNDSYLLTPPPVPDQSFTEEFDTVSSALNRGWKIINSSVPLGSGIWQQAGSVSPWFSPFSSQGTYAGYIGADYTSTSADQGIISNWLISPVITMQNGDKLGFYTRTWLLPTATVDSTDYANRLQVRMSTSDNLLVGSGQDVGSFKTSLLDINATYAYQHTDPAQYAPDAYPIGWTHFEVTIVGLNGPTKGRLAFRYFVEGGGSNGLGSGVGIDKVQYSSAKH
jgi:hypothetical protein